MNNKEELDRTFQLVLTSSLEEAQTRLKVGNSPIVIVFDEAGALLKHERFKVSPFLIFRRAARHAPNMFFLLVDTSSKVANFLPVLSAEPSDRARAGMELFPPFHFILTLGV